MNNNFNIEQFLDLSDYATDKRKAHRKGANYDHYGININ